MAEIMKLIKEHAANLTTGERDALTNLFSASEYNGHDFGHSHGVNPGHVTSLQKKGYIYSYTDYGPDYRHQFVLLRKAFLAFGLKPEKFRASFPEEDAS